MTISTGVSFLGQSNAQITRLNSLQKTMTDLQRQATTLKKNEDFKSFGSDAQSLQRYRMDQGRVQTYLDNINTVTTRINVMSQSMDKAADLGRSLMASISTQVREGTVDIESMKTLAQDGLEFMRDIMNTQVDGRYLFAGSSSSTIPLDSLNTINANMQTEVANWLNGTSTTAQAIGNVGGLTTDQLGINTALSSSGEVSLRVDRTLEIDYTVMANGNGFDEIVKALGFMANMEQPDPATDVPTQEEFHDMLNNILATVKSGVDAMDRASTSLGSKYNLIKDIGGSHEQDLALYQGQIATLENADTTEVLAKMQALQTQIEASYSVTNLVSQLSLVNYLPL